MSSVDCLREFVNERLTAAAEEIFGVFRKTIVDFEEKIDHQRRLLDIAWKPEIKLHRIELPQQHVCKEEEVLCIQERSSSLDQEDPEPPQIKEEQEELYTSQEGEQLGLKQETDAVMLTATNEEGHHSEDQNMCLNLEKTLSASEKQSGVKMPVIISVVSEPDRDRQLLSNNSKLAESQDQKGDELVDSRSTRNTEPRPKRRRHGSKSHTKNQHNPTTSKIKPNNNTDNKSPKCDICCKTFSKRWTLKCHLRTHTGEKPFLCKTCGKSFSSKYLLTRHMSIHTGEKPFICKTCGKRFFEKSRLKSHMRVHTGDKPYICNTCGKSFSCAYLLTVHMSIHTGEKPYTCDTCGKDYRHSSQLAVHKRRVHTDAKPYRCTICEQRFFDNFGLKRHMRIHTGEKPYSCQTCWKSFRVKSMLKGHMTTHTCEKPYSCQACGKRYSRRYNLKMHLKIHANEEALK